jgi:SAM-dependent methyltransferase
METRTDVVQTQADKKLQQEFNQWAEAGRGDEMEDHHSDITEQTIVLMDLKPTDRVLDLGCGDCPDIASYCQPDWPPNAVTVGIDLDFQALRSAAKRNIHIAQADFRQLPFSVRFDLILIRHPDVVRNETAWRYAISQLPICLSATGVVVITTYSVAEMDTLRGWLVRGSLKPLALDTSRLRATGLAGRDRLVTAYVNRAGPE